MFDELKIIPTDLLPGFRKWADGTLPVHLPQAEKKAFESERFNFYTSVSAVFSSKIEGEAIELDSYVKHRLGSAQFQADYTRKADDLYAAYQFAQSHSLTLEKLLAAHGILAKNLLKKQSRGRLRTAMEFILEREGRIEYVAAVPGLVRRETERLFDDLHHLLGQELSMAETFFYAAFAHLVFLKIHPLEDGNGRTARLLEKWFLAEKLGPSAWDIPSERYYYEHLAAYYRNVHLGVDYPSVDYLKALPFLQMLPLAVG